jgi:RNA polymerase sigma factor (TIGR02999 family)
MKRPETDVTELLLAWSDGDIAARDRLMGVVNDQLRLRARGQLAREGQSHTLQPTALVNEVYLKLVDCRRVRWQNRAHFFGYASQTMRRILVDHARTKNAQKRGHGVPKISIDEVGEVGVARAVDLVALDDALVTLALRSVRQARIVELRYFGGLTIEETAEVVGISASLVSREWTLARAWLYRELRGE